MNDQPTVSASASGNAHEVRTFEYYWGVLKRPLILAVLLECLFVIMKFAEWTLWAVNVALFIVVTWVVLRRRRDEFPEAGTAVILSGVIVGFFVAIVKLATLQKVYLLFNLFAEPVRLAIVGLVVAWLATLWFTRSHTRTGGVRRPVVRP